jgi:hypothetical protein
MDQRGGSSWLKQTAAAMGYRAIECPSCWGSGVLELDQTVCHCGGSGRLWLHQRFGTIPDAKLHVLIGKHDPASQDRLSGGESRLLIEYRPGLAASN